MRGNVFEKRKLHFNGKSLETYGKCKEWNSYLQTLDELMVVSKCLATLPYVPLGANTSRIG